MSNKVIRVAENLKALAKQRGVTFRQIEAATGITSSAVFYYAKGGTPTLMTLVVLADYFDVDLDTLVYADLDHRGGNQ